MKEFLIVIVAGFLLVGCISTELPGTHHAALRFDRENKDQLEKDWSSSYDAYSLFAAISGRAASVYKSASTNYSQFFETTSGLYGAVWLCTPDEAFGMFTNIAQSVFDNPEINTRKFAGSTNLTEPSDMLKAGCEYFIAPDCGDKLCLYMVGTEAYIEWTRGTNAKWWVRQCWPEHLGTLYPLLMERWYEEQRIEKREMEKREEAEQLQKAAEAHARAEKYNYELARAEQKLKEEQQEQRARVAQEEQEKRNEEAQRQREAARLADIAKKKAAADRIAEVDRRAKAINSGYYFQGRRAFAFLSSVIIDGKAINSSVGEVFELDANRSISWEVLQSDKQVLLIKARGEYLGTKEDDVLANSTLMVSRDSSAPMIDGQAIKGFVVLLGTRPYTTITGASKTVPLVKLLEN